MFHNCLGQGGYGEVYLATQHGNIQRQVAVKVLRPEYQEGSDAMNRLRDEGQALAFLQHPAIVAVHEFARIDGRLGLVMEYIEGADASLFTDKQYLLGEKVVLTIVREVAEALHHAYNAPNPRTGKPLELIHRDIKPANIRLSTDGNVKLLDFGVARANEMDRKASTMMGDVLLTSGFGAPETLGFGIQSAAGDVFALGVCLYQLLTGDDFYGTSDLRMQVNLALDSEEYKTHAELRLGSIAHDGIRALLTDMLQYSHEHRPDAGQVADRADELFKKLDGDTIGQWARAFEWPPLPEIKADLVGRRIDGEGVVLPPSKDLPESKLTGGPDGAQGSPDAPLPPPPRFEGKVNTLPGPPPRQESGPPATPAPAAAPAAPPVQPAPAPVAAPKSRMLLFLAVAVLLTGLVVFGLGVVLILASILVT